MDKSKTPIIAVIVAVAVLGIGAGAFALTREDTAEVASNSETTKQSMSSERKVEEKKQADIVGLASGSENLSTLTAAVTAADLVTTLQGEGPFTVFAPTNAAFAALPAGTLDTLLLPENKATLSGILTYHVVAGKVMSGDLSNGQVIKTVNGATLTVEIMGGKVMLVDAKGGKSTVTTADVEASNGVVHIIDTVVMPQ